MIKINYSSLLIITIFIGLFIYSNCQQPGLCRKRNKANGGLFEHEEYCDYYWRCDSKKSEPYLQACPNGLAFAGKGRGLYEYCGYPHVLKTCDENRYQAQEPVSSENCPYSYGIFPHKTSCSKYWQCWNNTASEQKCGFQLLYNEELASCDYPSNVKGCQKHPICKEVPNGPVLLKGSCILYWQCVGGYPRLERCPAGLAVQNTNGTLKCELATKVEGCGDKVTTPKYEESEDEVNEKKKKEIIARVVAAAKESKNQKELKKEGKIQKENKIQNQKPNRIRKGNKIVKESKNQSQKEVENQSQKEAKSQSQKESKNQEVTTAKEVKKKKKKRQQKQG